MDAKIAWVFEYHCVHNGFPSSEDVSSSYAEIDDGYDDFRNGLLFFSEIFHCFCVRRVMSAFGKEGFVASEVTSRG